MKANVKVIERNWFNKEELKKLERFTFQKWEKISHSTIKEVLKIIAIMHLNDEYSLYPQSVSVLKLRETIDFKAFTNSLRSLTGTLIELEDSKKLLQEIKEEKSEILANWRTISIRGSESKVKEEELKNCRFITEEDSFKIYDLEAERIVLKEKVREAEKRLKEIKESALIRARAKYSN